MATSQDIYSSPKTRGFVILSAAKDLSVRIRLAFRADVFRLAEGHA